MKAILVIDMPQNCLDCPCSFTFGSPPHNICEVMNDKSLIKENMNNTKPNWCPLKPMPEKMKVDYDFIASCEVTEKVVAMGWNACISTMLGEEE